MIVNNYAREKEKTSKALQVITITFRTTKCRNGKARNFDCSR